MWKLSGLVLILTIARVAMAQEFKKEFVDPQLQEARSTAVKIKGGTLVFLAGHTASQPRPDADLGNFDVQFKAYSRRSVIRSPKPGVILTILYP